MRKRTALFLGGWLAAGAAWAEVPLVSGFLSGYTDASADGPTVRLENRTNATTVARTVCGVQTVVSADGASSKEWDTTSVGNGWRTMPAEAGPADLLVLNPPEVQVHGGRLDSSANVVWSSDCVHVVRNRVIVPSNIRLTVAEGAIVKFGEGTGITVESGGCLKLSGRPDTRTYLTSIADDVIGGDTDRLATNAVASTWSISGSGTVDSYYTHIRYGTVSSLPTVGLAATATTSLQSEGKVRIFVSVSGTRTNRFSLHWRCKDGTAKCGVDYLQNEGEAVWPNTSDSSFYFDIPLAKSVTTAAIRHFTVEVVSTEDCNLNPSALTMDVSITPPVVVPVAVSCQSEYSAPVRLEMRNEGTVGKALSYGTEWKSATSTTRAVAWNTTAETDGWKSYVEGTNTVRTLVRNDASVAPAGGRMTTNETWTATQTHLVRNRVIVPSGVTLTVTKNAVVKFCEGTGLEVLSGGRLVLPSDVQAPAVFTSVHDDTIGGDTDLQDRPATNDNAYAISLGGSLESGAGAVFRQATVSALPTISIASAVEINESDGVVRIPVSVSGSRTDPFLIHWRVCGGTAEYGTDYTAREGVLNWISTSDGAQSIVIPIVDDGVAEKTETLVVELYDAQSANVSRSAHRCTVTMHDSTDASVPVAISASSDYSASVRLENRAEGTLGKAVVVGTEWASSNGMARAELWDTTTETDSWKDFWDETNVVRTLIRNDASVAVAGGRMTTNETWTSNQTHLVRNRVLVPSGVTLTVAKSAVVKFCEGTGIEVLSGGRLVLPSDIQNPAVFCSAFDDTIGGDTDLQDRPATNDNAYTISISGSLESGAGAIFRQATISSLPTISIASSVEVNESDEKVSIPISVSGTRVDPFLIHWRVSGGTAEYGTDYTVREGVLTWISTSDGAKSLVIPLVDDGVAEETETLVVELYDAQCANVSRSAYRCTVTVRDSTNVSVPTAVCTNSEYSASIRLENRAEGTAGKAVVCGTEWVSSTGEARAELWDTTTEADGWKEFVDGTNTVRTLIRNDASVSVAGGRMTTNETWTAEAVHIVRNWVIIPSGVTLTVMTNAVVKFCENTGISTSGGQLIVAGSTNEPAVFTSIADDTVGGDVDLRDCAPTNDLYTISVSSSSYSSPGGAIYRHTTFSALPTVSIAGSCEISEADEQVKVAVSVSGTRSGPFRLCWRAVDGTAEYGTDYTLQSGVIDWASSSDATKYIVIPIANDGVLEASEQFTIELYEAQNANVSRSAYRCTVTIRDSTPTVVPVAVCTNSEYSASIRLENRSEGTSGKAVVCGTEWASSTGETRAELWDTTAEADGWKEFVDGSTSVRTLIRNDASVAVAGGRMTTNETWTADAVHIVRNWVIIPSGVTLTVMTNAVVKFCENTGISTSGGQLIVAGSTNEPAVFTSMADDTVGGDTDRQTVTPVNDQYTISVSSGSYSSSGGAIFRHTTFSALPTVSIASSCEVSEADEQVRLAVSVSGTRSGPFRLCWRTVDGTAEYGKDYTLQSGVIDWASSSDATKYIVVPIVNDGVLEESEQFTIELYEAQNANVSRSAYRCTVTIRDSTPTVVPVAVCTNSEYSASVRLENRAEGTAGKAVVCGTEWRSANGETRAETWDTTAETEGWKEFCDGSTSVRTLVRNEVSVEGGRMATNEIWTADVVHVVRNVVIVPSGVTLTVTTNAVVKFCEGTGITVSGGRLIVAGSTNEPAVFTSIADDTVGGDTDRRAADPVDGQYTISASSSTYTSPGGAVFRYTAFSTLPTVSIPGSFEVIESDGVVRVPVSVSGTRSAPFRLFWRAVDGTAEYGTDYALQSGVIDWAGSSDAIKYIVIPIAYDRVWEPSEDFTIELYEAQNANVSRSAGSCRVIIRDFTPLDVPVAVCTNSVYSPAVRFETRDIATSYAAPLVTGVQPVSDAAGVYHRDWDTTDAEDGWQSVECGGGENATLWIVNDPSISVQGGRIETNTTWTADKLWLVRHWIIVPSGVTLTIAAGSVVKFCDATGIKVESGGRLVCAGTSVADVVLTSVHDDTVGGDTDRQDVTPTVGSYSISSSGTFTDTNTAMRYGTSATFGTASIVSQVVGKKQCGHVLVPLSVSGSSRSTEFAVDWVAIEETAKYGEDYLSASGRVTWASSSAGTQYLDLPLDPMSPTQADETFTIRLTYGRGVNLSTGSVTCKVILYDTADTREGDNVGFAQSEWSGLVPVDSDAGRDALFIEGDQSIAFSTLWATNGAGCSVTIADAEKNAMTLHDASEEAAEGYFAWSPEGYEDGRYDLSHKIFDVEGRVIKTDTATFIVNRDVWRHGGVLTSNETWAADYVHLVTATVYVPSGLTLTISPNAIVKFMPGTGIVVMSGGSGVCKGAVFTHAYDDTMGGDTFFDGNETTPSDGKYALTGNWEDDASTQYRFVAPLEVGGTLTGVNRWAGYKTYKVKSSITLASGATLEIEPGAVVKFGSGMSLTVNSGATLNAQGTRSAPIVFTSIKDDEFGGDTNGDGESTLPFAGDWARIVASGAVNMNYCRIRCCNNNSDKGAIQGSGGKVVFDNGIIESSVYECVRMNSGTFISHNSIFRDASMGFGYYGGSGTYVYNGIVADCTTACRASNKHFYNTVFYRCATFLESTASSCDHCVFYNPDDFSGAKSASQVGNNGNVWADPKFEDVDIGDYRLKSGSPCIDAGNGQVSSETDFYGQPRQNIQEVTPSGTADANGKYPDIGIYEYQPRFAGSDVDLLVKSVTVPDKMIVGESVDVSWRIANVGSATVEGPWSDKVELMAADGSVAVLGTALVKGGLPAGGERTVSSTFRVPSISLGTCVLRVTTNYARDVFEGTLTTNNVMKSGEVTVELSAVDFSTETTGKVKLSPGKQVSYSVDGLPTNGGSILLHSTMGEKFAAYVGFGKVPTSYSAASSYHVLPNGDVIVSVPKQTDASVAYLMLEADAEATNQSLDATVSDEYPAIYALSKESMPSVGKQSLSIYGVGMSEVTAVELRSDTATIVGTSVRAASDCELTADFDLTSAKAGNYHVVARGADDAESVSASVIVVLPNVTAKANLELSLQAPSAIRPNRWYEAVVTVSNTGDADAVVPIVALSGAGIEFKDPDGGKQIYSGVIHLIAIPDGSSSAALVPGASALVKCSFRLTEGTYGLHAKIVDPVDVSWDSLYSRGETADERSGYARRMDENFGSVQNFVSEVISLAVRVSLEGRRPKNALRLYDTLIKNKEGLKTSLISGWLVSSETMNPVPGYTLGFTAGRTNEFVYVTTDATGAFVAYDVPTGLVSVASEGGCVKPEQMIRIGSDGIRDLKLIKYEDQPAVVDVPEITYDAECNDVRILPFGGGATCLWLDGGALHAGSARNGWTPSLLLPDIKLSTYDIYPIQSHSCAFVGVAEEGNGLQSLICCRLDKSDSDGLIVARSIYSTNILSVCQSVCIASADEEHITVAYSQTTNSATSYRLGSLPLGERIVSSLKRSSQPRTKTAGFSNSVAAKLPREITASIGIADITVQVPVSDKDTTRCCTAVSECSGGGNFSVDIGVCDARAGVKYDKVTISQCRNYLSEGTLGCSGCDRLETTSVKHGQEISIGCSRGFPIPYIHKLKGVNYKKLKNANFSFDVSADLGGDIQYSYEQIINYAPSSTGRVLMNDYTEINGGYTVYGDVGISYSIGRPEVLKSRGYGRKGQEKSFFSASTGLINAKLSFSWKGIWVDGRYSGSVGTGTISGSLYNLEVQGTLVNDNGDFGWQWGWSVPTQEHEYPVLRTKNKSMEMPRFVASGEAPLGIGPAIDEDRSFSPYSVANLGQDGGFVYLRQGKRSGVVSTDIMVYDTKTQRSIYLTRPDMDVGVVRAMDFENGGKAVVFVASQHRLNGSADEALDAIGRSKLYVVRYDGCHWGDVEQVSLPGNEYVGNIVVSQSGSLTNVVAYGATIQDGESYSHEIHAVFVTAETISSPSTVVQNAADGLISVDVEYVDNGPVAVCSFADEESGDKMRIFGYNGTTWDEDVLPKQIRKTSVVTQQESVQQSIGITLKSQDTLASHSCDGNCKCGCQKSQPKPKPGCGCSSSCKCKGLCGTNCKCEGGKRHQGTVPQSCDPNEMAGPAGVGENRVVKPGEWMDYTIYFENKATASAAAQDVYVTLPKDVGLDWDTFELGEVVFGENIDTGLSGKRDGSSEFALPGTNWTVRTDVTHEKSVAKWHLRVYDPTTVNNYPDDPYAGFLPPNDDSGRGEGHLRFRVKVKDGAVLGSRINASATIVFDTNAPITTDPAWWNTVGDVRQLTLALGDESTTNLTLVAGEPFGALPTPKARKGYAFKGWFFGPNGTGGEVTADTVVPSGLENIYADWEANAVNVWVDGVNNVRHYDEMASFTTLASVTNGYTNLVCTGWVGTGDVPALGTSNVVSFKVSQESSLKWRYATNYWVSVAAGVGGSVALCDGECAVATQPGWYPAGTTLAAEATANEGYAFARWVDVETGAECGRDGARPVQSVAGPWLLRAEFTNLVCTVQFDLGAHGMRNGGGALVQTVVWGCAAVAPVVKADVGYAFSGWDAAFDVVTGDLRATAQYKENGYAITYENTKGCRNQNPLAYTVEEAVTFSALTNPPGWRFLGWNPAGIARGSTGDTNVVARWERLKYAVSLDGVVGSDYVYGQELSVSTYASVTNGYTNLVCVGWVGTGDVPALGTSNVVSFKVSQESSLKWRYATNYWVSVAAGVGGSVALCDGECAVATQPGWYPAGTTLAAEATANEGYAFARWVDVETGAECGRDGARLSRPVAGPWLLRAEFVRVTEPEPEEPTLFDSFVGGGLNPKGATYNGFIGEEALSGTFTLVVKKPKKGASVASVTLTKVDAATGKKVKQSGDVDVVTGACTGDLRGLTLGASGVSGTVGGVAAQGTVDAAKAKDASALAVMNAFNKRLYGAVLADAANEKTMLTVSFAAKGKAKVSGTVAGAKVSGAAQMSVGDTLCAVPFVYVKKSVAVSCVFWFDKETRKLIGVTGCGNDVTIVALGSSDVPAVGSYTVELQEDDILTSVPDAIGATPTEIALNYTGKKFDAGKSAKVTFKKNVLTVDTSKGPNVSGLALKYNKGALTGSLTVYALTGGKLVKNKFTVTGVLVEGNGHATATNKKLKPIPLSLIR